MTMMRLRDEKGALYLALEPLMEAAGINTWKLPLAELLEEEPVRARFLQAGGLFRVMGQRRLKGETTEILLVNGPQAEMLLIEAHLRKGLSSETTAEAISKLRAELET